MGPLRLLFKLDLGRFIAFIFVFVISCTKNDESDLSAAIPIILWILWMQRLHSLSVVIGLLRWEGGRKIGGRGQKRGCRTDGLLSCSNNG